MDGSILCYTSNICNQDGQGKTE